ncbi:MAG: cache domain-containing protein [Chloroflexi bacterium]|nr:cache domain-containing protein [Chloroflexota bacterium]
MSPDNPSGGVSPDETHDNARTSGKAAFVIARGIRDQAGSLQGIVVAAIAPGWLGGVFDLGGSGQSSLAIVDRTGRLVCRFPQREMSW